MPCEAKQRKVSQVRAIGWFMSVSDVCRQYFGENLSRSNKIIGRMRTPDLLQTIQVRQFDALGYVLNTYFDSDYR